MTCPTQWIFSPQVSVISGHPTPSITPPVYVTESDVVLTYPFSSPTLTLTLRTPRFGDSQTVTVESARNNSMGGVLTISRNSIWPIVDVFNYDFEAIDEDTVEDYFAFIAESIGKEIGLRDHRGRQWRGFILNPDGAASEHQICDDSLSVSFRGVLVS